jgi:hypothetical protein
MNYKKLVNAIGVIIYDDRYDIYFEEYVLIVEKREDLMRIYKLSSFGWSIQSKEIPEDIWKRVWEYMQSPFFEIDLGRCLNK